MKKSDSLYLKIAGFTIAVYFKKGKEKHYIDKIYRQIKHSFENFLETDPKKIDFTIEIIDSHVHVFSFLSKKSYDFILILRHFKNNRFVTFSHISLPQFETIILKVLSMLLLKKGFFLHGSAVAHDNEVFIFTGKSGAGKSTIMRLLSKKFFPIADDSLIIKKEGDDYFAYQTPFTEKAKWIKRGKERYRIKRIFFLKKAKFIKTKEIRNTQLIIRKIFKQFFTERKYLMEQSKLLFDFINHNVKFYYFYFNKTEDTVIYFSRFTNSPRGRNHED